AVAFALDAGKRRKVHGVFEHEGVGRARIEPDVEDVVDLMPILVGEFAEEALARAGLIPGVGAFALEGVGDARVDARVVEDLDRTVARLAYEDRDRHAPGALARDHPVGPALDHAGDAVLARRLHPARRPDGNERAVAQGIGRSNTGMFSQPNEFGRNRLVHRDEPLRRVAEGDWLLRAPGMRVLVL